MQSPSVAHLERVGIDNRDAAVQLNKNVFRLDVSDYNTIAMKRIHDAAQVARGKV
jgi:gamma-glutamylcysteine synthetase